MQFFVFVCFNLLWPDRVLFCYVVTEEQGTRVKKKSQICNPKGFIKLPTQRILTFKPKSWYKQFVNTNINAALHILPITSVVLIYIFILIFLIISLTFNEVTAFQAFIFYSLVMSSGNKYCVLKRVIRLLCAKYNNLNINSCSGQGHSEEQRSLLLHVWNVLIHFFLYKSFCFYFSSHSPPTESRALIFLFSPFCRHVSVP